MKKNSFSELSNEQLVKRRDLLKGVAIGFGILFILILVILLYLFAIGKKLSVATLIPIFILPATLSPLMINWGMLNNEIKSRNLK